MSAHSAETEAAWPWYRWPRRWREYWFAMTCHTQRYAGEFDLTLGDSFRISLINSGLGVLVFVALSAVYSAYVSAPKIGMYLANSGFWIALCEGSILVISASAFVTLKPVPFAWLWLRVFGGHGSFLGHLSRVLVCTNLEWLNAILAVAAVLPTIWNPRLLFEHTAAAKDVTDLGTASVIGWLALRLYYLFLQLSILLPFHYNTRNPLYYLGGAGIILFNAMVVGPYLYLYAMLLWPP